MKLMTRTAFGLAAVVMSATPSFAQTKWNLPAAYPPSNYQTENLVQFAKDVSDATGGKLEIIVHSNASLFKAPEIKRAVMTGQAQMGEVLMSIHENEDPIYGIDIVPFIATGFDESVKLWNAAKPAIEKKLESQRMKLLFSVPWPPQGLYSSTKEVKTIADLEGQKWRAYNVGTARIGEAVGAQAVTVQAADMAQALATGVVTAWMSSGSTGYDIKVWESQKYFYDVQAWLPRNIVFVNKAAFDGLDEATQAAVIKAAAAAEERGLQLAKEKTNFYLSEFKAKGMVVEPPTPELQAELKKIGKELVADWLERAGETGQAVLDTYKKM